MGTGAGADKAHMVEIILYSFCKLQLLKLSNVFYI